MIINEGIVLLAQGLGAGLLPVAPGTLASLLFLPVWWCLAGLPRAGYLAVWALICLVGVPLCGHATLLLGVHDAPSIVWDEFGGLLLTLAAAPRGIGWGISGFLAFRLFDVLKPGPVGWVDANMISGLGIVLDDLVAGVFALLLLQGLWWLRREMQRRHG